MSFVFDPGFLPAFAFNKDILLYIGLTFMAYGITQMVYCGIKLHKLRSLRL